MGIPIPDASSSSAPRNTVSKTDPRSFNSKFKEMQYLSFRKGSEFLCRTKYENTLPPLPMPLSLFCFSVDPSKYACYQEGSFSSLENAYRYKEIQVPINEILPLSLIDKKSLSMEKTPSEVDSEDQELLNLGEKTNFPQIPSCLPHSQSQTSNGSMAENPQKSFSWLRKHEPWQIKSEARSLADRYNADLFCSSRLKEEFSSQPMSVDRAVAIIEQTFSAAECVDTVRETLRHPLHPNLSVKKVFPIFPDLASWPDSYPYKPGDVVCSPSQPSVLEPPKGFARPLNLVSNPKERFFYMYAPTSSHPASQQFCVNFAENPGQVDPSPMPTTDLPLPFVKDFYYQTSIASTPSTRSTSNLYLISVCDDKALYHPIQSKLLLKSRRNTLSASKQDTLLAGSNTAGIMLRRREFSNDELAARNEKNSKLLPKSVMEEDVYEK